MSSIPLAINPVDKISKNLPPFTLWLYKILSVFPLTGFTGIDHMAIGSQFTGFAKLFVNILTLGSWYFYDIVQVYNTTNLRDKGLKIPFLESGSIGKGRIDDLPSKELKQNEKNWLYLLFTLAFGLLYFILSHFLTSSSDPFSTGLRYFSGFILIATLCLGVFTLFSFSKKNPLMTPVERTPKDIISNLSTIAPPQLPASLTSPLTSSLSILKGGGGELDELKKSVSSIMMDGGKKESSEHIYFGLILLFLPIIGFTAYNLRKKKNI